MKKREFVTKFIKKSYNESIEKLLFIATIEQIFQWFSSIDFYIEEVKHAAGIHLQQSSSHLE